MVSLFLAYFFIFYLRLVPFKRTVASACPCRLDAADFTSRMQGVYRYVPQLDLYELLCDVRALGERNHFPAVLGICQSGDQAERGQALLRPIRHRAQYIRDYCRPSLCLSLPPKLQSISSFWATNAWEQSMMLLVSTVLVCGVIAIVIFRWLYKNVLIMSWKRFPFCRAGKKRRSKNFPSGIHLLI